jgi:2-oxoglutarate ferredoxin oxidoreductase subunit gamma
MAKKAVSRKRGHQTWTTEMLFAGFGGQGIMFMGKLLAQAGLEAGQHVTWMPSYGAEVRGGTAYSMTKISEKPIASPIVTSPDILVVMNKPSLAKYGERLKEGGILIANKSLIDEVPKRKSVILLNIPMTKMAARLGNTRCANMIALGALVKRSRIIPLKFVLTALKVTLKGKEEAFAINKKALEKGFGKA